MLGRTAGAAGLCAVLLCLPLPAVNLLPVAVEVVEAAAVRVELTRAAEAAAVKAELTRAVEADAVRVELTRTAEAVFVTATTLFEGPVAPNVTVAVLAVTAVFRTDCAVVRAVVAKTAVVFPTTATVLKVVATVAGFSSVTAVFQVWVSAASGRLPVAVSRQTDRPASVFLPASSVAALLCLGNLLGQRYSYFRLTFGLCQHRRARPPPSLGPCRPPLLNL